MQISSGSLSAWPFIHVSTNGMGKSGPFKVRGCINFLGCVSQNPVMVVSVFLFSFCQAPIITRSASNFTRAKLSLQEHSKQNVHLMASMDVVDFKDRMERGSLSVHQLLRDHTSALVQSNRLKLLSILKTIVFCGRQSIPLRGHREQSDHHLSNPGNFRALLDFRIGAGDAVLADRFKTAPSNAQYNSPQIQNELIACTGEWIREQVLQEVRNARLFSVCAEEAADCSSKEQLPLVIRFVDATDSICEEFVDFVLCDMGTTGNAIADKILGEIAAYGLNISSLRGQGYI